MTRRDGRARSFAVACALVCAWLCPPAVEGAPRLTPGSPNASTSPRHRVVRLRAEDYGQVLRVRKGDILDFEDEIRPAGSRLEFDESILEVVSSEPSDRGGRVTLRCVRSGRTDLVITAPAARCGAGTPCPPVAREFRTTLDVGE